MVMPQTRPDGLPRTDDGMGQPSWVSGEPALLLVEDDAGDALLVEELVADSALKVRLTWVRSMAEAVEALATEVPDCILLDLHLPDAQGLEAVSRVRASADQAAVVVLTGLAEEETGLAAVAAGAQDYLVKGRVEPELFVRAVRYAIQRKQSERAAVALQASRLQAQENARLERGLLPRPLLRGEGVEVVTRYRRAGRTPCWAVTSTTSCRKPTARSTR